MRPISKSEFADIVEGLAGYSLLQVSYISYYPFQTIVDSTQITQRVKQERISVPLTQEDLFEGMDTSLHSIKSVIEQHCQPER
jgi:hypothetical protein